MALSQPRLKRLIRQRERLQRLQEQRVAAANALRMQRLQVLDTAQGRRQTALATPVAPATGGTAIALDPAHGAAIRTFVVHANREIETGLAALRHSEAEMQTELDTLADRRRDTRAIEPLLERAQDRERRQLVRREATDADELASIRWLRNRTQHAAATTSHNEGGPR